MSTRPEHYRPAAIALAIALPLLVMLYGWVQLRPTGQTSSEAAQFNRMLATHEPEIIVFGSSLANRGVDLALLGRTLGVPESKVLLMQMPHSSLAHWYALLKNRVFANGHEPKLVLVVDALTSMLNHDLLAEMQPNVDRLVGQMSADEPAIAAKVFRVEDQEEFRQYFVRQKAGELRQDLMEAWRDQVVTLLFAKRGRLEEGQKLVEKVNEELFSNENMDYSLHQEKSKDVALSSTVIASTVNGDFDLRRDALLAEMQALCDDHGTNLFYVRVPLPPSNADMDYVPPEIESDAVQWMADLGSGYLDMRALDLDDSYFEDMRHLSRQGSELFTGAVARVLAAMNALTPGAGKRVIRGMEDPSRVEILGQGPSFPVVGGSGCRRVVAAGAWSGLEASLLADYGDLISPLVVSQGGTPLAGRPDPSTEGCAGAAWIEDGQLIVSARDEAAPIEVSFVPEPSDPSQPDAPKVRWIAPGTTVTYTFDSPWALPDNAFRVYVRGIAIGDPDVPVTVRIGEGTFNLKNLAGRVSGAGKVPAPHEPGWTLSLTVPAGGPIVMIHHLAIGVPPSTAYVLGDADTLHGMSIRVVGGRVEDTQHKATFSKEPPPIPFMPRMRRGARGTASFAVEPLLDLADSAERDDTKPNKCTPVRVLEDGVPLAGAHAPCFEVTTQGQGRTCFAKDLISFSASDATDPMTNGRIYTLALTPRRVCDVYAQKGSAFLRDSWWLYPGDVGEFEVKGDEMASFRDGANILEVEVIPHVAEWEVPMRVQLLAGDMVVLDKTWQPTGKNRRERVTWSIDPPLMPRVGDLRVRFENPSTKSFGLITQITIAEDYDMFSAEGAGASTFKLEGPGREVKAVAVRSAGGDPVADPKPSPKTSFGAFEAKAFPLWPVSDSYLEKIGLPAVSPVRLFVDGEELVRITDRKVIRTGCTSCFYHSGQSLLFFKEGVTKSTTARLELNPVFPMTAPDGTQAPWVYPGTSASWEIPDGWRGRVVKVLVEGFGFHPQKERVGSGVFVDVGAFSAPMVKTGPDGRAAAGLEVDGATPATIVIRNEPGSGSFFLVRRIRYEDEGGGAFILNLADPEPLEAGDAPPVAEPLAQP